jgi:hypothetical protein
VIIAAKRMGFKLFSSTCLNRAAYLLLYAWVLRDVSKDFLLFAWVLFFRLLETNANTTKNK